MNELKALGEALLSPSATVILGVWMYFTIKSLKAEVSALRAEIHDNGFVRKDLLQEMKAHADEVHEKLAEDIRELRRAGRKE